MKRFSLGINFDEGLLLDFEKLNSENQVHGAAVDEVYGSLPGSLLPSSRVSSELPDISLGMLEQYIRKAHNAGLKFNYIFNPTCLGNKELNPMGLNEILQFIDNIIDMGVDVITVTIPYFIEALSKRHKKITINASVLCFIDTVRKAHAYFELGAKRLTLADDVNRDFRILKAIRKNVPAEIELLVDSGCLMDCPFEHYHYNIRAHSSEEVMSPVKNYCTVLCSLIRYKEPYEFIRGTWVRPEDIHHYTNIGIDLFKLQGRTDQSTNILQKVKAYMSGQFEGDILSLLGESHDMSNSLFKINNRSLDGFFDFFVQEKNDCRNGCLTCSYCRKVFEKAVSTSSIDRNSVIARLEEMKDGIVFYSDKVEKILSSIIEEKKEL